jgi:hypothetical protein
VHELSSGLDSLLCSSQSSGPSPPNSSPSDPPKLAPRPLNIKRFAYSVQQKVPSNVRTHSTSADALARFPSSSAVPHKVKGGGKASARKKPGSTLLHITGITDEQWARLRSCVCCEVLWTNRKSIKRKMDHLRSCARTHFASEEHVERLILKQLESDGTGSHDGAPLQNVVDLAPRTLLDDVIETNRSPRTHRTRARQPEASTSNEGGSSALPLNTRSIKNPTTELEGNLSHTTKALSAEDASIVDDLIAAPPSTQMPPPSRFTKAVNGHSILREYFGGIADAPASPPSTQQLPPSRFGSKLIQSQNASLTSLDSDAMVCTAPAISARATPNIVGVSLVFSYVLSHLRL